MAILLWKCSEETIPNLDGVLAEDEKKKKKLRGLRILDTKRSGMRKW
jgi:hypothetical protein